MNLDLRRTKARVAVAEMGHEKEEEEVGDPGIEAVLLAQGQHWQAAQEKTSGLASSGR